MDEDEVFIQYVPKE